MSQTETFLSEDENFFKAVDKQSGALRTAANDLATFLATIKNSSPEINLLIQAAKNIKTMDIKKFDEVINNFREALSAIQSKMNDKNFIGSIPLNKIMGMAQKQKALIIEAGHFIEKAEVITKRETGGG